MSLTDLTTVPDPGVVDVLENALLLAKKGKLRNVVVVGMLRGGDSFTDHQTTDIFTTIGHLENLKHRLLLAGESRGAEREEP